MPTSKPLRAQNLKVVEKGSIPQESPRSTHVLVVDDDTVVLKAISSILEREGFSVQACDDAIKGLEVAKDPAIDVIVLDINLPHLSGMELLKIIKAERPEVEVIMMTAYATVATAVESIKAGACEYIPKPFEDIDQLTHTVTRAAERKALLDGKRGMEATRIGPASSQEPRADGSELASGLRRSARVLVVDDDTVVLKAVSQILQREGFVVRESDDAVKGLEAAKDAAIDVVVLDINLPQLSGMDLLKAIKAERPDVEVIMMTAYPTVETAVEAVKAGAYDYVTKPFEEIDHFSGQVGKAAARKALRDTPRSGEGVEP